MSIYPRVGPPENVQAWMPSDRGPIAIPFECDHCKESACYGLPGKWFCTDHWQLFQKH